jgi:hypothetical protein
MNAMLLALFVQSIIQDAAGDFVVARNQSGRALYEPHFVSKFDQGGMRLAWTLLPPGGRGAMSRGPQGTFFYVNSNFVLHYAGDGRLMSRYELKLGCNGMVNGARFTRRAQLLITGELECVVGAVGTDVQLPRVIGRGVHFTAEVEPRGGTVRWLLPGMGGAIVEEGGDGSVMAASANPLVVTRVSEGAKALVGQRSLVGLRNMFGPMVGGPSFLRLLADGRVALAGTIDAKSYPTTPDAMATGAECRPYTEPFDPYQCSQAYFSVFSANLDRMEYSTVLPNSSRLVGARLQGEQVELFAMNGTVAKGDGACPRFASRFLWTRGGVPKPIEFPLPSQFRAAQMFVPDGATTYSYSPADGIDAVLSGDTARPEPDYCVLSAFDGTPAGGLVAGSYYTMYFSVPRPGVKLTLDGKPVLVVFQSPSQINFYVPKEFYGGVLTVDGVPVEMKQRLQRWPTILLSDPYSTVSPRQALITDERGRLLTRENAAGPGDRVIVYSEGGAFAVIASGPDEYPVMYPIGLRFESVSEVPGFPNLFVGVYRVPVGRPTDQPRRFFVGSPVGGGGPTRDMEIWLRLQY